MRWACSAPTTFPRMVPRVGRGRVGEQRHCCRNWSRGALPPSLEVQVYNGHSTAEHCIKLQSTELHYISLQCTEWHYIQDCSPVNCTMFHCSALNKTAVN